LNTVIETTLRKKNNNKLFDKFWYQTREDKLIKLTYEGIYVDILGNVALGTGQSNLRMNGMDHYGTNKAPRKQASTIGAGNNKPEEKDTNQINKEIE
jgi:hypothetical protein